MCVCVYYIYIYRERERERAQPIHRLAVRRVCKHPWINMLASPWSKGWRAASAARLQGNGSHENGMCFTDAGITKRGPGCSQHYRA